MSTRVLRWVVGLGAVAAMVWYGKEALRKAPVAVRLTAVEVGTVESTVTNSRAGTVRARRRVSLSPEASGRVVSVPHAAGERVITGELLVRLDDALPAALLAQAERQAEAAQAQRDQACVHARRTERELARNRVLASEQLISDDLLDRLESAHEAALAACTTAQAQALAAESAIQVTRAELEKTQLFAPFDGVLALVAVEEGEWVTPAPPLMPVPAAIDLIDTNSIYISAPMDEVDSAVIHAGQLVRVTLDPYPHRSFAGRVGRVAPFVLDYEAQNRTVEIEVELTDATFAAELLPGTSADVEVILEQVEGVPRLPAACLMEGGRVLMLANGYLEEREVQVGLRNWDWVEVTSGLQPGEQVVSSLGQAAVQAGALAVEEGGGISSDAAALELAP
ncbi:MAG: efflux RND transporter periplasmic adaptor subunit, partial [Planctomycetota bacterium]|nr:efflux transporter periplasmic adaptor subunit [Planctomycetota bacterium]MDP6520681.1 efflux RND transporter periplasmic adaptor subunit [Planctomycetota bacterium]MDP6839768.1 efflux RND transporter periplasmic adaptor subunit [Planctomycetota bacterium]